MQFRLGDCQNFWHAECNGLRSREVHHPGLDWQKMDTLGYLAETRRRIEQSKLILEQASSGVQDTDQAVLEIREAIRQSRELIAMLETRLHAIKPAGARDDSTTA